MINRRDAIKRIGGIAGAAGLTRYLPGCSSDDGPVGITTYVYMMMENRSYDHFFGSRVTLSRNGKTQTFHIVGEDEADPPRGAVSFRAPLAQALIGARVGDIVEMEKPPGEIEILAVE